LAKAPLTILSPSESILPKFAKYPVTIPDFTSKSLKPADIDFTNMIVKLNIKKIPY
jgi:hypothetical protein